MCVCEVYLYVCMFAIAPPLVVCVCVCECVFSVCVICCTLKEHGDCHMESSALHKVGALFHTWSKTSSLLPKKEEITKKSVELKRNTTECYIMAKANLVVVSNKLDVL